MSQLLPAHDLIYFDFEKTASIASQLEGGLQKEIQETHSDSGELGAGVNMHFLNLGGKSGESRSKLVVRNIHHDLLNRVEDSLRNQKLSLNVNAEFGQRSSDVDNLHSEFAARPYVRAEGNCRFHDFERIKTLVNGLNDILGFAANSAKDNIIKSDEYQQLLQAVNEKEGAINKINNRKQKSDAKKQAKLARESLDRLVETATASATSSLLPEWQVSGIDTFIDLIVPKRKLLLLQPFDDNEDLQFICNLKELCFVDSDLDNLLFAYGSQPNVLLTVFGLVTHVPPQTPAPVVRSQNVPKQHAQDDVQKLERAFEAAFDGIKPIENFGRFSYYPRVTVYPLAVYRTIRT